MNTKFGCIGFVCLFLVVSYNSYSQQVIWTREYDTGYYDQPTGIATDGDGNVIVTGYFNKSQSPYDDEFFTIKYSSDGDTLWTRVFGGPDLDQALAVATDRSNNIIVAGYSQEGSQSKGRLVKYDPDGNFLWTTTYTSSPQYWDGFCGVATDKDGNIIVTGWTYKNDPAAHCVLVVKYGPNSTFIWVRKQDYLPYDAEGMGVAVDNLQNTIVVTGYISPFPHVPPPASTGYITIKYNANGEFIDDDFYSRTFQGGMEPWDGASSVAIDRFSNIIVTGTLEVDNFYQRFTIKYTPDLSVLWTKAEGYGVGSGIDVDSLDNIIVTSSPVRTYKYSPEGTLIWSHNYPGADYFADVAVDRGVTKYNDFYVTGPKNDNFFTVKYGELGVDEFAGQPKFVDITVSPNPFLHHICISFQPETAQYFKLNIYDIRGVLVRSIWAGPSSRSMYSWIWDAKDDMGREVSPGVYFVVTEDSKGILSSKKIVALIK